MATCASSLKRCRRLTISCRRSWVIIGMGRRITVPSLLGVMPRSARISSFSIALSVERSKGCTTSRRGSGALMVATWLRGIAVPYNSTRTESSMAALARPVRMVSASWRRTSTDLSIRSAASSRMSCTSSLSSAICEPLRSSCRSDGNRLRAHQRADVLAGKDALDGALIEHVEHAYRQVVLHAE